MNVQIFGIVILLFSIVVHEYAHGWMAFRCGDPTAKYAGRLTLNPLPHIDIMGSILLPLFLFMSRSPVLFGWAKPVPVNPVNFNNPSIDNIKVAGAGPLSNIILAVLFTASGILSLFFVHSIQIFTIFQFGIQINLILALFNLIPLSPLDGSHILEYYIPYNWRNTYYKIQSFGPILLLIIIVSSYILPVNIFWLIIGVPYKVLYNILLTMIDLFVK